MTDGDDVKLRPYRPGEPVWVFALGGWQLAVVIGTEDGRVLARYHRIDGSLAERAFPPSSVLTAERP
jgi:hypothetical protein